MEGHENGQITGSLYHRIPGNAKQRFAAAVQRRLPPAAFPRGIPPTSPLAVLPYPVLRRVSSPRGAALRRPSPWPGALRRVLPPRARRACTLRARRVTCTPADRKCTRPCGAAPAGAPPTAPRRRPRLAHGSCCAPSAPRQPRRSAPEHGAARRQARGRGGRGRHGPGDVPGLTRSAARTWCHPEALRQPRGAVGLARGPVLDPAGAHAVAEKTYAPAAPGA